MRQVALQSHLATIIETLGIGLLLGAGERATEGVMTGSMNVTDTTSRRAVTAKGTVVLLLLRVQKTNSLDELSTLPLSKSKLVPSVGDTPKMR